MLDSLDDPTIEAFGMLLETHNELVNETGRRMPDLTPPWLGVLIRLARTPGNQLRMTELARDMTMSTSGLTRLVDRIETAGHVKRERCPDDRRGLLATLTPAGRSMVIELVPSHVNDLRQMIGAALDEEEVVQLTDLLRRVRNHIRGMSDSPG